MKAKSYLSGVQSEHEFDDLPSKATFDVSPQFAAEIVKLAALVKTNELHSVEKFCYATSWHAEYFEELDEVDSDAETVSTECDCLTVSADMFWFTATLKHSNVSISTERFDIAELSELLEPIESEVDKPEKPPVFSWRGLGAPRDYIIYMGNNYAARVLANGEMSEDRQKEWLDAVVDALNKRPELGRPFRDEDPAGELTEEISVCKFEKLASAAGISMTFDDDLGKYRWESPIEGIAQPGWETELEAWQDACVANGLIRKVKDQYAESIIGDDSSQFDAIEIHGVIHVESEINGGDPVCEIDDEEPEFYAVYLHLKEGGVECVGDFTILQEAVDYGSALSTIHGWQCSNYVNI